MGLIWAEIKYLKSAVTFFFKDFQMRYYNLSYLKEGLSNNYLLTTKKVKSERDRNGKSSLETGHLGHLLHTHTR